MGVTITIRPDGIPRQLQALGQLVAEDVNQILDEAVEEGLTYARDLAYELDLIGASVPGYAESFEAVRGVDGTHALANTSPYANIVEWGAGPHKPPLAPLEEWAREKFGMSDSEAHDMAVYTQRSIAARGLPPKHVLGHTMEYVMAAVRRDLRQYRRDLEKGQTRAAVRFKTKYGVSTRRRSVSV